MFQEVVMISDASTRGFTYQAVAPEGIPKVCRMFISRCQSFLGVAKGCRDLLKMCDL